jgi:RNA-directed DNA polymerase
MRRRGLRWVVDGDIATCFDSLDHDLLMAFLHHKISDNRVLTLFQQWLDVGVMKGDLVEGDSENGAWVQQAQRGAGWLLKTVINEPDPYESAEYESYDNLPDVEGNTKRTPDPLGIPGYVRQSVVRQIAINGLLLGAAGAKRAWQTIETTARTTLSSPAGRRLLKKSAWVTGGLAGAAVIAAATAYVLHRRAGPAPTGALQGSPLSPLLANIYLHPFDVAMKKRGHNLIRFADDWVILCATREESEESYNNAVRSLARLRLKINLEKTRILSPQDKLEWLGAIVK